MPSNDPIESLADPATLADAPGVEVRESEREFAREKYEALAERYDRIDGVVQVGVVDDGAVLLQDVARGDGWHPPGGNVAPGQDWVEAARESVTDLTGVAVTVDRPLIYERSTFRPAEDPEADGVLAEVVTFRGSLAEPAPEFRADPTLPGDLDHPLYGDGEEVGLEFRWFESVPDDADPSHADEVRRLLEGE